MFVLLNKRAVWVRNRVRFERLFETFNEVSCKGLTESKSAGGTVA